MTMLRWSHRSPERGAAGEGCPRGLSRQTVGRGCPSILAWYVGGMSADNENVHFITVDGPTTTTTFLASEVIGVAAGVATVMVYFRGGSTMVFDGMNSTEDPKCLMASILKVVGTALTEASS